MATWVLEPGCERPLLKPLPHERHDPMKIGTGTLDAETIVDRAERWYSARVDKIGTRYRIYPPDTTQSPVFLSTRLGNGTARRNAIAQLSRAGIDVTRPPTHETSDATPAATTSEETTPVLVTATPADLPAARKNGTKPSSDLDTVIGMLTEAESRILGLLTDAEGRITTLTAKIAAQDETIAALRSDLTALARSATPPKPPTVSRSSITRRLVLDFFETHRGMKASPEVVRMNIEDQLLAAFAAELSPAEAAKGIDNTFIPSACSALARAGQLQGGGQAKRGPGGSTRGIYWLPADEPADTAATAAS